MAVVKVQRGNVQLTVDYNAKDTYLAKGFDVINDLGEITEYSNAHAVEYEKVQELTKKLEDSNKKITDLKKQLKELKDVSKI